MAVIPSLFVSTTIPDAFSTATDIAVSIEEEGLTVLYTEKINYACKIKRNRNACIE